MTLAIYSFVSRLHDNRAFVRNSRDIKMTIVNFKDATDVLIERVTLVDIAEACGSHPNSVERARLQPGTKNFRGPPANWQAAVIALAQARIVALHDLLNRLRSAS